MFLNVMPICMVPPIYPASGDPPAAGTADSYSVRPGSLTVPVHQAVNLVVRAHRNRPGAAVWQELIDEVIDSPGM